MQDTLRINSGRNAVLILEGEISGVVLEYMYVEELYGGLMTLKNGKFHGLNMIRKMSETGKDGKTWPVYLLIKKTTQHTTEVVEHSV